MHMGLTKHCLMLSRYIINFDPARREPVPAELRVKFKAVVRVFRANQRQGAVVDTRLVVIRSRNVCPANVQDSIVRRNDRLPFDRNL